MTLPRRGQATIMVTPRNGEPTALDIATANIIRDIAQAQAVRRAEALDRQAKRDAEHAAWAKAKGVELWDAFESWRVDWKEATWGASEPVRTVADLHEPRQDGYARSVDFYDAQRDEEWPPGYVCHGCDVEGGEWEHPSWPCRTAVAIMGGEVDLDPWGYRS